MKTNIKDIISKMTLEEKAGMCSGKDFWHLKGVERLGIPSVMVCDGPHGLRKQDDKADHLGINDSIEAVCFPTAVGAASSFDRDFMYEMGRTLGEQCQAENVSVLLGPAVNIKRSPLCGRNFEYFSEDPYLSAQLATSQIKGVQSKNIGTSMKHYLANNQETRRMTSSSQVDERTLREIYLATFETPVKEAQPWTVMCSYNRVNGEYVSQSHRFLTEVLRDEWGFEGYVVTDWGACDDRVKGLQAGQDLEMPYSGGANDKKIVEAVKSGLLEEAVLDKSVKRILTQIFKYTENRDQTAVFDCEVDHKKARLYAHESMVLLQNNGILPLKKDQKVAFIGKFAEEPRFQGSGSSFINTKNVVGALVAAKNEGLAVTYAPGFSITEDVIDEILVKNAVEAAKNAEIAVVFAGLPSYFESEGFDRTHMSIPNCQNHLIAEIAKVQPNLVVVLHNGSPVEMPWVNQASAILEAYLAGEAVGEAEIDILYGKVNPSGKLAETFPVKCEDNPSSLNFPGEGDTVEYREGLFVGYRYYDAKKMPVLFPFGHGLSYTTFSYSNLSISSSQLSGDTPLTVTLRVKNTGEVAGKASVQLYVAPKEKTIIRADKELKGFAKVTLEPKEEKEVTMTLDKRSFAYYDVETADWAVIPGTYEILIGESSQSIVLSGEVERTDSAKKGWRVNRNTTIGDIMAHPATKASLEELFASKLGAFGGASAEDTSEATDKLGGGGAAMHMAMLRDMPLRAIASFAGDKISPTEFEGMIQKLNDVLELSEKE